MVSAGYSGLEVSPSSGFFVCCMEPKTHERSQSLGRLLGREAAVSAIIERIERMGSSTKEARCLVRVSVRIMTKAFETYAHPRRSRIARPMIQSLSASERKPSSSVKCVTR